MASASGLPAGPGLPDELSSSEHHVLCARPPDPPAWRIGELLATGTAPSCWPEPPGEAGIARLVLTADPAALSAARDFARKTLADWGLTELTWDATTVVSELFTNAITHATPARKVALRIMLLFDDRRLAIVVTDPSARPPVRPAADAAPGPLDVPDLLCGLADLDDFGDLDELDEFLLEENGRGLAIVAGLSLDWGWAPLATGGKAVWAVLEPSAEPSAGQDAEPGPGHPRADGP